MVVVVCVLKYKEHAAITTHDKLNGAGSEQGGGAIADWQHTPS